MSARRRGKSASRAAAVVATALAAWWIWGAVIPAAAGPPKVVAIRPGMSAWQVARVLKEQSLIRSQLAMAATAYLSWKWRRIRAGRYEIPPSMNALEILHLVTRPENDCWTWLTIPEGYTLRQIARAVEENGIGRADALLSEAEKVSQFRTAFPLPETGLEGYLFPDTYRVDSGQGEAELLQQMLRRFEEVVWRGLFHGKASYRGRSLNEIIILASLVEAEAKLPRERPLIAGVLMNRLRRGQRLECDATVQYALGDGRKSRLTYQDTEIDSPYNTYLHAGLPPGPICNPGVASIRAAMEPASVPYLYYVARKDGSHIFSRTLQEHRAAIARVRRGGR